MIPYSINFVKKGLHYVQQKKDHDIYYSRIGQIIKAKREKAGKSQEQLSKHLGFKSRISIANIESGSQKIHVHTLVEVAKYLKINVLDLLPDDDLKKDTSINPAFEKLLNKEGISSNSSEGLKSLISKIDSFKSDS